MGALDNSKETGGLHISRVHRLVGEKPGHSVGTLATELRLSKNWLERMFKQHAGCCLHEFILTERMKHAAKLLATTDWQIKEIADTLGYAHAPSFIRVFLRHYKKTPRQYRLEVSAG